MSLGRTKQGEPVVEPHPGADHTQTLPGALIDRKQKREWIDEVRGEVHYDPALAYGLEDQVELVAFEIAKPAVDELAGPGARPVRDIVLLEQHHAQPPARGVAHDACPRDASADDHEVDLFRDLLPHFFARRHQDSPRIFCSAR